MGWTIIPPLFPSERDVDELTLLDLRDELRYSLNDSARSIWQMLLTGHSRQQIFDLLDSTNEITFDQINNFVDEIIERDLLMPDKNSSQTPIEVDGNKQLGAPTLKVQRCSHDEINGAIRAAEWKPAGKHIVFQKLGDEIGALNKNTGVYFKMTGCASTVWTGIAKGLSQDELSSAMKLVYDGSDETVVDALVDAISQLLKLNLIHPKSKSDLAVPVKPTSAPVGKSRSALKRPGILIYKPFDLEEAKELVIRFSMRSCSMYTDRFGRPNIGIEFSLERRDASAKITGLGLDFESVKAGGIALTEQMVDHLFLSDLTFAAEEARNSLSNFDDLPFDKRLAAILLIFKLGPAMFSQQQSLINALFEGDFDKAADLVAHSHWYHQYFDNKDVVDMLRGTIHYRIPDRQSIYLTDSFVAGSNSVASTGSVHPGTATRGSND